MISDNLEFFNVGELGNALPFPGKTLERIPKRVRNLINQRARFIGAISTGAEIRFVSDAPDICLYLGAIKPTDAFGQSELRIMLGNFEYKRVTLELDRVSTICLTRPNFDYINENVLRSKGFAPNVWRIVCSSPTTVFCGIETFGHEYRAPLPEEKPGFHCLCYGSSITNSFLDGYPLVMGQRLGIEVSNLGLFGACFIENEISDYLASLHNWDAITLELGINVLDIDPDVFEQRVDYLVAALVKEHPAKPIVLITLFPSISRARLQNKKGSGGKEDKQFCEVLRKIHATYKAAGNNIHLIEGDEILDDYTCLSTDFLHPRAYGHAVMGLNLAEKLNSIFSL
jgi:lysophospholipase L1-like esterase